MAKKPRPAAGSPNVGKLNSDRVGTFVTAVVDLMPKLLYQADWAVERAAEFRVSEPLRVDSMMNRTRKLLQALADLLTKAVPFERERMARQPYQTDYGTRLEFREPSPSETEYQPGNWTESGRKPVRPLLSGQYPSVMDELLEEQELRPAASWLHSARGAVLTYAADFWYEYGFWPKLAVPSEGFAGWPLDLPEGQRLAVRNDVFHNTDSWLGWGRCAADFPRLVNDAAVKEWIAHESPTETTAQLAGDSDNDLADDGPIPPDGFMLKGQRFDGLAGQPFRALQYLWTIPTKAATKEDLAEPVFGDREALVEVSQLHNVRRDLNEFFRSNKLPYEATVTNGYLAVRDAPPQPAKSSRKPPKKSKPGQSRR